MLLHTVNKSPFTDNSLQSCIRCCQAGQAILLIEDGVYGALDKTTTSNLLSAVDTTVSLYVLAEDLDARGINQDLIKNIKIIKYLKKTGSVRQS